MGKKRDEIVLVAVRLKRETFRRYREWAKVLGISEYSLMRKHLERTITPIIKEK